MWVASTRGSASIAGARGQLSGTEHAAQPEPNCCALPTGVMAPAVCTGTGALGAHPAKTASRTRNKSEGICCDVLEGLSTAAYTCQVSETVGSHLKAVRLAAGLTLRAVQERTSGRVKNGYLSQIENDEIKSPSPTILFDLSQVYGIDYADLLDKAGHPVPVSAATTSTTPIAGIPAAALADLDDRERREVLDFLAYLKSRRPATSRA